MSFVSSRFLRTDAFRLSATYAGLFAISVLALGAIVFVLTDRAFRDQIAEFSRADIAAIEHGYVHQGMEEAIEVVEQVMAAPGESDSFLLQQGGVRLAGNLPPMAARIGLFIVPGADKGLDILGVGEMIAPGVYVFAGSGLHRIQVVERDILRTLGWLFALVMLFAVAGGAVLSRSFLSRSDAMARACRAIMDGDFNARIPVRGTRDELDRLAMTINEMLDRIVGLMGNLRQVTNDVAHDLRTPVSQLRQRLERGRQKSKDIQDCFDAFDAAIVKTDEILSLFAALLRIAQIEGGELRAEFDKISVVPVLKQVREMFDAVMETAGHRLHLNADSDVAIRGDRVLVIQMLTNLIENAIIHTPPGTRIWLSLFAQGREAIVIVRDDGPGVPTTEHPKLFQRFYRCEASRTRPGYGLGLSLVAAIAELHNATVTIMENSGPGLAVRVAFPAAV